MPDKLLNFEEAVVKLELNYITGGTGGRDTGVSTLDMTGRHDSPDFIDDWAPDVVTT